MIAKKYLHMIEDISDETGGGQTMQTETVNKFAHYPQTDKFKVIDSIGMPHPYCITLKHVTYASDNCSGMLGESAIEGAEKQGAHCGIKNCNLKYSEHEQVLLVEVSDPRELKDIPELKEYLLSIKDQAIIGGYAGFAFTQMKTIHKGKEIKTRSTGT